MILEEDEELSPSFSPIKIGEEVVATVGGEKHNAVVHVSYTNLTLPTILLV